MNSIADEKQLSGNALSDQQKTQIEIDMRVAIASGYGDNLNVPVELRSLFNELNAEHREKVETEEDLQRFARQTQENTAKDKDEDFADAINNAVTQEWLKSRHEFAGMELTGAEWRHVSEYTKQNHDRIVQQWLDDGLTREETETGLKAIDIMGNGGPKTEAEKETMHRANQNDDLRLHMQNTVREAGIEANSPSMSGNKPASPPATEVANNLVPTITPTF